MSRRKAMAAALAASLALASAPASASPLSFPIKVDDGFPLPGPPDVTAASWLLYDEWTDTVLASFLPQEERAIASTTKIMTGLLVLEQSSLADLVTVSSNAAATGEREIGLVAGEQVTMEALFKALLIHSANDAATAIAEHISGSVSEFVDLMNQRAAELGLSGTSFANPHGLDAPDHYSTAQDLLGLTLVAMSHPDFLFAVRARAMSFPPAPDGRARSGTATNVLLGHYEGTIGVKTGFTDDAQLTFVASSERDGRRLYVVVLGSEGAGAHFADARALLDYGFHDLGMIGSLSFDTRYQSAYPRTDPAPLVKAAGAEALIHLSAAISEAPGAGDEEPAVVIVNSSRRLPEPAPSSVGAAFLYWFHMAFGSD